MMQKNGLESSGWKTTGGGKSGFYIEDYSNTAGVSAYDACCDCMWTGGLAVDKSMTYYVSKTGNDNYQVKSIEYLVRASIYS